MSKAKQNDKKNQSNIKVEAPQSVAEIFSMTRDVEVLHPYHLDGDLDMYSQQKIEVREELKNDPQIVKELNQICKLYEWTQMEEVGKVVSQKEYKHKQRLLALILRPDIDKQQLQFIVEKDWEHDRIVTEQRQFISKQKMVSALWELVDVWTIGASRQEYLSFCRLLKKKLDRAIKADK